MSFDFDDLVIGSGFGGSVCALRLAERGRQVAVVERGRRLTGDDLPATNWDLRRYLWMPRLGFRGPQVLSLLGGALVLSGSGVGGGSLVYAGVLAEPGADFFERFGDDRPWRRELEPHFATARRMLGATSAPAGDRLDEAFARLGGRHRRPDVGIFCSDTPGETVDDPYFDGEGPRRTSCIQCGACMTGCRFDAKNTLDKNYLFLAERRGATVLPERSVVTIAPIGDGTGADGYRVETKATGSGGRSEAITASRVVVAAGTIGTNRLLLSCRDHERTLPKLSARLGSAVTNNLEEFIFVRAPHGTLNDEGIAVHSAYRPDENTMVLAARFAPGASLMALLGAPYTDRGDRHPGLLGGIARAIASPITAARMVMPRRWAETSRTLIAMQSHPEPAGRLTLKRGLFGPRLKLDAAYPTTIAPAHDTARLLAADLNGAAQPFSTNALLRLPATAHLFGGCPIGRGVEDGVVDAEHRVHGYENLFVVDGSVLPPNMGIAPSLTIAAMAERVTALLA